jgi:hypothetical protein
MEENRRVFSSLFRLSSAERPPLKIGLLLDSPKLKRCFISVLEDIRSSNFAVLDCVIMQRQSTEAHHGKRTRLRSVWDRLRTRRLRDRLLFDLYERWDSSRTPAEYALAEVDCATFLAGVHLIEVSPITKGFSQRFPADAVQEIKSRDLDVMLRFGFNILRGDILDAARYGIWSFHHGDNEFYRGGPALFWELWERNPLSGVILQRLTEELDAGTVLCKSLFATSPTLSLAENRHGPYLATTHFVIRKLRELHQFGYAELEKRRVPDTPYRGRRAIYRTPTNADMSQWIARELAAKTRRIGQHPKEKRWRVGIRKGGPFLDDAVARGEAPRLDGFTWLEDGPEDNYRADPFLAEHGGKQYLFVEEFDRARDKGVIAAAELDSRGAPIEFSTCLELPHHLSFPFIFREGDDWWMIPECAASRAVTLYRASRFPLRWEPEKELLQGEYVDTVVWRDGAWWMLTTVREPPGYCVHSVLFVAPSLTGDWQMHPSSPLFNDVRSARNAGRVFARDNRWFRLSQDCSIEYGRAFQFNEILVLNERSYCERLVARVEPDFAPQLIATHTYNRLGDLEVIDGCFLIPSRSSRR